MTYQAALNYLNSFINYERIEDYNYKQALKLERMADLAKRLGNPHHNINSIHIAGTKGKGSTAAFVHSILKTHGSKVGLYTSPHLVTLRERIRINDELISEDDVARLVGRIRKTVENPAYGERPTFFELYTALAFLYFKERNADFAIYEVGMGGRLDATNILKPLVCAITPISYDHIKTLGATLAEIAFEKAGIIKENSICVVSPQEKEAQDVIERVARSRNARLIQVGRDIKFDEVGGVPQGTTLCHGDNGLEIGRGTMVLRLRRKPSLKFKEVFNVYGILNEYLKCESVLLGEHQIINAAAAVGIIEALSNFGVKIPADTIKKGLRQTRWSGRLELGSRNPLILLDGAHNRASARALAKTVREKFRLKDLLLILGVSKDKDIRGIVEELEPISKSIILTKANIAERAEEPGRIREFVRGKETILTDNLSQALRRAQAKITGEEAILITGSLFLVGEAKVILEKNVTNKP